MTAMSFLGEPIAVRYKKIEKNEKILNGCGMYDVGAAEMAECPQVGMALRAVRLFLASARNLK